MNACAPHPLPHQRALGALAAVALTIGPVVMMWMQPVGPSRVHGSEAPHAVLYLNGIVRSETATPQPVVPRRPPAALLSPSVTAQTSLPSNAPVTSSAITPITSITSIPPLKQAPPSDAPAATASAPRALLPLDAATLRRAQQAAKSEVQKMAEASGQRLDSLGPSASDKLNEAVAQSTKPECLGAGGSLLQAFVMAYWVVNNKCRVR